MRDFQSPHRSPAYGANGMAATSHPLATQAAVEALKAGGNAIDAGLAALALLCVVEPHQTGLGGDCFALISEPDGSLLGLNGSGRSSAQADPDAAPFAGRDRIEALSGQAVTVPGAVHAWERLAARGRFGLARALLPAIVAARDGFVVTPRVASDWAGLAHALRGGEIARVYTRGGRTPEAGDVWWLPALAETLEAVAISGAEAIYTGRIAEEIVAAVTAAGGLLTLDDLAAHESEWVTPLSRTYRGHEIVELPPANHGLTALQMLGLLEGFDLASLDPVGADKFHLEIECARLAYGARDRYVADRDAMPVSPETLLSTRYQDALRAKITMERARPIGPVPEAHTDTVYLTVIDDEGRACSVINSLYTGFGSGLCTPSGIVLQSRGSGFVTTPGHPNRIGPAKRPLHTLIPGLVRREGRLVCSFGVMGGAYQACGHAHVLTNLVDHGLDVQAALDSPRVFFNGPDVEVEHTAGSRVMAELARRGHRVTPAPGPIGGGQAIWVDTGRGVLIGGSDPRKDGCALGY